MKGDLTRLQPCLWVQAMERVEMEQICVTKQGLKSDSCPTLAIGREQCERKYWKSEKMWNGLQRLKNGFVFVCGRAFLLVLRERCSEYKVERLRKKSNLCGDRILKSGSVGGNEEESKWKALRRS